MVFGRHGIVAHGGGLLLHDFDYCGEMDAWFNSFPLAVGINDLKNLVFFKLPWFDLKFDGKTIVNLFANVRIE